MKANVDLYDFALIAFSTDAAMDSVEQEGKATHGSARRTFDSGSNLVAM
jgi:hypothetical protein